MLGYPEQGRSSLQQALALAQEIEQPSTTAFVHAAAGALYFIGGDEAEAMKHVHALRTLGETGTFYVAWTEMLTDRAPSDGPASEWRQDSPQAEETISLVNYMGSVVGQGMQLLAQAQKLVRAGQPAMALQAVDQALAWIEQTEVRLLEAEAWRVRGELLLAVDDGPRTMDNGESASSAAEACFRRALEVARTQQGRWLELRASVSLARLWGARGRRDEARELLAGIYGWFTEGFDTVDLVQAKSLLGELA
jgi:adenylate cyclase